jgi:exopolyphosphatase/guanosine-5'-triphosphate,3'-diphosphate pyrophosphatase
MRVATVDIGTNTTLLLIAEGSGPGDVKVLCERAEITRLGRGIGGDGRLGKDGIERTLAALEEYGSLCREQGAKVAAIGTEALRRAPNAADFLGPAGQALGVPIEVIAGDREAALSHRATATSFPVEAAGTMVVIDIGGGSTEVIRSEGGAVQFRRSLPLGSVRLTEQHVRSDPAAPAEVAAMTGAVRQALAGVPLAGAGALVGVAGTVTSLAAMAQSLASYDPALVHGYHLTVATLERQAAGLAASTQAERERLPGLDPRRADVILAGATILLEIARAAALPHVLVSDRGIRWGLLFEMLSVTS